MRKLVAFAFRGELAVVRVGDEAVRLTELRLKLLGFEVLKRWVIAKSESRADHGWVGVY